MIMPLQRLQTWLERFSLPFLVLAAALSAPTSHASDDALVMGVFPRRNPAETTRMFTPLADHLSERLGRKVVLVTSRDFETFWQAVKDKRFDIIHYNQYHYIRSSQNYQVVAHIEEGGKSTIAGAIYVRRDSGITNVAQLRGRSILFGGGEDAMVSYIANRYLLLQAGLKKNDYKSLFAVNPPNSILAMYRQQADAAGAGDGVLDLPIVRAAVNRDELIALAVSTPLLQLPVVVKRSMSEPLKRHVQSLVVFLKDDAAGREVLKNAGMTGMGKADDKDYDAHRQIVRAVMDPVELAKQ